MVYSKKHWKLVQVFEQSTVVTICLRSIYGVQFISIWSADTDSDLDHIMLVEYVFVSVEFPWITFVALYIQIVCYGMPRNYPPRFGLKLVELFHDLVADKAGIPSLPGIVPTSAETFQSMSFGDDWSEASMVSVCRYLRAGVHLKIPPSFYGLLPTKL